MLASSGYTTSGRERECGGGVDRGGPEKSLRTRPTLLPGWFCVSQLQRRGEERRGENRREEKRSEEKRRGEKRREEKSRVEKRREEKRTRNSRNVLNKKGSVFFVQSNRIPNRSICADSIVCFTRTLRATRTWKNEWFILLRTVTPSKTRRPAREQARRLQRRSGRSSAMMLAAIC